VALATAELPAPGWADAQRVRIATEALLSRQFAATPICAAHERDDEARRDEMTPLLTVSNERCHVLQLDPALAEAIPDERRQQALEECVAREVSIPVGRWHGAPLATPDGGIGMLLLSGLLIRRVGIVGRYGAELLGAGDVLRPWESEEESPTLSLSTAWRVLQACRLAVLDDNFTSCMGSYPELAGTLVGRAVGRSRSLAVNIAIVHQARVDVRLHMLFWHLAGRWGKVGPDGVTLPLRLTHAVLADLSAARRPTVTSALTQLAKRGVVRPTEAGWLLAGDPPGELHDLSPAGAAANGS
jgi:hypothetical protein